MSKENSKQKVPEKQMKKSEAGETHQAMDNSFMS